MIGDGLSFLYRGWVYQSLRACALALMLTASCAYPGRAQDTTGHFHSPKKLKFTAYPAGGYSPETSFSFGAVGFLVFNNPDTLNQKGYHRPSSLSPYFLYTLNNQFLSAIDLESYFLDRINLNTTLRFFNYPDYYYGTGNHTGVDRELFTNKFIKWEGQVSLAILPTLFAGLGYEWTNNTLRDLDPDGDLLNQPVNGYQGGNILGFGPVFRFDSRDNILYPEKGIYMEFKTLFFPDLFGNDYVYNDLNFDFRAFRKLFKTRNILGFQFFYHQTGGRSIPFYKLPQLGGDSRLRGIEHENRYRDRIAWYTQLEVRRELFWRLGGVIFAGVGKVAGGVSEMNFSGLHYAVGIGGRFRPFKDEKLNVRMDIGKGPDRQFAVYLAIREAF